MAALALDAADARSCLSQCIEADISGTLDGLWQSYRKTWSSRHIAWAFCETLIEYNKCFRMSR